MAQEDESQPETIITKGRSGDRFRSSASWIVAAVLLFLGLLGLVYSSGGRWKHLLLALAVVAIAAQFATRGRAPNNIEPEGRFIPIRDPALPAQ
jgi:fatty acid desaturase